MNKENEILDLEMAIRQVNSKIGWRKQFFHEIAEELYDAGYRKVYDDRFILKHDVSGYALTEEETKSEEKCNKCYEQFRVEIAAEIIGKLKKLQDACYKDEVVIAFLMNDYGLKYEMADALKNAVRIEVSPFICPVCGKETDETEHGRQYCADCKEKLGGK